MPTPDTSVNFRIHRETNRLRAWFGWFWSRWWGKLLAFFAVLGAIGFGLIWILVARDLPSVDKLRTCSGNVMVWLGEGPYPGTLPPCFTLTRDKSVWDDAVAKWKAAHGY